MEQQVLKTQTEKEGDNKTTLSQRISIQMPLENGESQFIHVEREEGVTTVSFTETEKYEGELTKFEATIEDEKLKKALSYIGGMVFQIGANVIKNVIDESLKPSK